MMMMKVKRKKCTLNWSSWSSGQVKDQRNGSVWITIDQTDIDNRLNFSINQYKSGHQGHTFNWCLNSRLFTAYSQKNSCHHCCNPVSVAIRRRRRRRRREGRARANGCACLTSPFFSPSIRIVELLLKRRNRWFRFVSIANVCQQTVGWQANDEQVRMRNCHSPGKCVGETRHDACQTLVGFTNQSINN